MEMVAAPFTTTWSLSCKPGGLTWVSMTLLITTQTWRKRDTFPCAVDCHLTRAGCPNFLVGGPPLLSDTVSGDRKNIYITNLNKLTWINTCIRNIWRFRRLARRLDGRVLPHLAHLPHLVPEPGFEHPWPRGSKRTLPSPGSSCGTDRILQLPLWPSGLYRVKGSPIFNIHHSPGQLPPCLMSSWLARFMYSVN